MNALLVIKIAHRALSFWLITVGCFQPKSHGPLIVLWLGVTPKIEHSNPILGVTVTFFNERIPVPSGAIVTSSVIPATAVGERIELIIVSIHAPRRSERKEHDENFDDLHDRFSNLTRNI